MLTNKQLDAIELSAKFGNHVPVDVLIKEIKRLRRIVNSKRHLPVIRKKNDWTDAEARTWALQHIS